jgi:hypothetical protein
MPDYTPNGLVNGNLAPTGARTVPSITIQATDPNGKNITIGAIKSMERRVDRNMTRRRELDSNPPGVTVEIIPGATTTFELTITRAMMYQSSMLEAFGYTNMEDLISQNIPFQIIEIRNNPDGSTAQTVTYTGCYFKSNPQTVDIDGDWLILQSAVVEVASATVVGGPLGNNPATSVTVTPGTPSAPPSISQTGA